MAGKPRAEAPARPVPVRLSPAEYDRIEMAARDHQQTVSQFLRAVAAAAVRSWEGSRTTPFKNCP
jgi:hypothetical protein